MKEVKVLQVYRTFFPDTQGGGEEVIRQISKNTKDNGINMRIVVPSVNVSKPECIDVDGITVYRVPELCEIASCNIYSGGFKLFTELVQWADVVHYHYPWPFQDILHFLIVKKYKKKTVVTYHSDITRQRSILKLYRPLKKRFLNSVDAIVATSTPYKQSSPVLQHYKSKVSVIPLGLDEDTLPELDLSLKSSWEQKVGKGFFFFVGVLRYYKGLHILLDAAAQCNVKVVIAGDGAAMSDLKKQKQRLGLKNVELLGRITDEDKTALINLSRAIVLPSFVRAEAFGITLLEGMYFSRPLITAELDTGVNYVNKHGTTGLTVEAESASALADAMMKLSADSELAKSMGVAARQRYDKLFTGKQLGSSYADLYQKLSNEQ